MANSQKSVLIVEDDTMINTMYKTKLEASGFKVFSSADGAGGLEMAKKEKPDIILLDVIMPRLDGFSVLSELQNDDKTKKIPVILLTNLGTDEDIEKGKKMGAIDYIVKANITPTEVVVKVNEHLK
jgi:DNA-binding response OmpR family regulator